MGLVLPILTAAWAVVAPERAYELSWTAPIACPDHAAVVERIDALLVAGREPSVFVSADGVIEPEDQRFALTLRIETSSGSRTRTMYAGSCEELATVTASLVAIAVDPGLTHGQPSAPIGEPVDEAGSGAELAPEPQQAASGTAGQQHEGVSVDAASTPAPRPDPRVVAGVLVAGAGLSVGVLPSVAPTVHAGAGLSWRTLYAQASVRHRIPRRAGNEEGGAELWTLGADVRGCWAPGTSQLRFPLCLGVEVGTIAGRSFAVTVPGRGRAPWVATSAGGGLVASLGRRLGIAVGVDVVVPLVRAGFVIAGLGELHRVGPVAMDAAIGLQVKIP